jgi:hypothetical protein
MNDLSRNLHYWLEVNLVLKCGCTLVAELGMKWNFDALWISEMRMRILSEMKLLSSTTFLLEMRFME